MKALPFFRQETEYYCGPAIVQMIFAAHGISMTQRRIATLMKTNKKIGTRPSAMIALLTSQGFNVRAAEKQNSALLKKSLKAEEIPIVLFIEPEMEWDHYAIVRKIKNGVVSLSDPDARTGRTNMIEKEFIRRWKDRDVLQSTRWAAYVSKKSIAAKQKQR
jgi:ABC-type bacteriocin/lantibiotic exporter with double-glycine peptidase domain